MIVMAISVARGCSNKPNNDNSDDVVIANHHYHHHQVLSMLKSKPLYFVDVNDIVLKHRPRHVHTHTHMRARARTHELMHACICTYVRTYGTVIHRYTTL